MFLVEKGKVPPWESYTTSFKAISQEELDYTPGGSTEEGKTSPNQKPGEFSSDNQTPEIGESEVITIA